MDVLRCRFSIRLMMFAVALLAFFSAMGAAYDIFHRGYWQVMVDKHAEEERVYARMAALTPMLRVALSVWRFRMLYHRDLMQATKR